MAWEAGHVNVNKVQTVWDGRTHKLIPSTAVLSYWLLAVHSPSCYQLQQHRNHQMKTPKRARRTTAQSARHTASCCQHRPTNRTQHNVTTEQTGAHATSHRQLWAPCVSRPDSSSSSSTVGFSKHGHLTWADVTQAHDVMTHLSHGSSDKHSWFHRLFDTRVSAESSLATIPSTECLPWHTQTRAEELKIRAD